MSLDPAELAAYLAHIGYDGPCAPTLATLSSIVAAHATRIPFENLDVLLGRPPRLDARSLVQKLVHDCRGGYCFEHNSLLLEALATLGFSVKGLGARVVWNRPEGLPTGPRTHMLLRVMLPEGEFLADVGFGGLTLTSPIRFQVGPEQATAHEPHRLAGFEDEIDLQALLGGEWTRLYHFTLQPCAPIDYEVANWYTATHPASLFTNNLLGARPEPDRRFALFNRDFTIRHRDGQVERRRLADASDLGAVLREHFTVSLPEDELAAVWQKIANA